MTRGKTELQPMRPGIARVPWMTATGVLLLLGTAAYAGQGWEPTVSMGAEPPKVQPPRAQPKATGTKTKAARAAAAAETDASSEPPPPVPAAMPGKRAPAPVAGIETGSIKGGRAEEYCTNIADTAADARFAWQKKVLADMEQEIAKRVTMLEEKIAEYQKWLVRRDEFSQKANETLLRIYARMRPDAAASQLAALDEETAAAIITKLEPRTASLILNEMEAARAVRLTATISGAGKILPAAQRTTAEAKAK